jgi:hypothetical protein
MTDKEIRFVKWIKSQCKKYGVKHSLRNVKYLKLSGNIRCSGYFDDTTDKKPTLVVSMNRKDWIEILVHEYCHLTQWSEGIDLWGKAGESLAVIEEWLGGNEVKDIDYHLGIARDLELDNEKRSVELMKRWGLDVDIDNYIRKANAYIQFYNYMGKTRRWSNPKNAPYGNQNVVKEMPTTFQMNYKKMSKRLVKLFENENI